MQLEEIERHRRVIETSSGPVSCLDVGDGPVALFVHGVFVNALLWRNVIGAVRSVRRCIAVDLPAHGQTPSDESWDLSLPGLTVLLASVCDAIGVDQVDLVGNDTGGALTQVFAATHPELLRTLTLTDCDTQDNFPPEAFRGVVELARQGELVPIIHRLAGDLDLARSKAGLGSGYERPGDLPDEVITAFLAPLAESDQRAAELQRFVSLLDPAPLLAVEDRLRKLAVPTLIVWGTHDVFFEMKWAHWLRDTIPGARDVVEIDGGRLFFPDERAAELAPHLLHHWGTVTTG